ncbi:MAG: hypothetical protein IPJ81_13870 [Chitinophagaceae bacterium]|nr:hypothetical protein [Chitinophagaceae bacterium]
MNIIVVNKKKIVILFLVFAGFVATGYYYYNKKIANIKNSSSKKVSAIKLYKIFSEDPVTAKKEYTQKILEVSGEVMQITKNQQHQNIVLLKSGNESAFINCTMEEALHGNIKISDIVSIKGICNGMGDSDTALGIFGDVYLIRCYNESKR